MNYWTIKIVIWHSQKGYDLIKEHININQAHIAFKMHKLKKENRRTRKNKIQYINPQVYFPINLLFHLRLYGGPNLPIESKIYLPEHNLNNFEYFQSFKELNYKLESWSKKK